MSVQDSEYEVVGGIRRKTDGLCSRPKRDTIDVSGWFLGHGLLCASGSVQGDIISLVHEESLSMDGGVTGKCLSGSAGHGAGRQ